MHSDTLLRPIRDWFQTREFPFEEKKMFGGIAFLVDGKLTVCVQKTALLVRVTTEGFAEALAEGGRPMHNGNRESKGFIYLPEGQLHKPERLAFWLEMALGVAQAAKPSGKKKTRLG